MPPRREFNSRFETYVKRRRTVRTLSAAALSMCLLVGAGAAFAQLAPQGTAMRALANTAGAASATAVSLLDEAGSFISNIFHPKTIATSPTPTEHWNEQQPPLQTATATSSEPATLQAPASIPSPASSNDATASELAVSNSIPFPQGRVLGASTAAPVERVVEKEIPVAFTGVTLGDLAALRAELLEKITAATQPPPPFPQQIAGNGNSNGISYSLPPAAQRIDQLANVTITNPTIVGGSLSGTTGAGGGGIGDNATTTTFFSSVGHFTTGIIDALTSTAATIANLGTTELVATNSTTTNLYVSGTARLGTGTGVLQSTSGVVSSITNGTNGQVLKISGGVPTWGADLTGSGGGSSAWATTTDSLAVYTTDPTQVVLVGTNATSTTGNILEVKGNTLLRGSQTTQGAITASSFTATSSAATSTFSGALSVLNFAQTGSATSTGMSGWNISAGCYAINNQCLSFSTLAGLISLPSQVTGTLPVANGGTGSTTLSGILKGNGTSQVATAVGGADYEFPLSFNSPLSRAGNTVSLSTSGNWSGTLSGFSATQLIALGFSTTSADAWKSTRNFYSTTSADYWLTQKTTDNLSQGSTNKYYATSLFAGDLAATTTDALAQGATNKYWSNTLFDTRLSATSSLPNIITLANLSLPATQLTNFGVPFFQLFSATTTSALAEGSNLYYTANRVAGVIAGTTTTALAEGSNLYFTNARADARINATSTIGTLTSAPNLGTVATSLTGFLKATAGVLSTALIDLASNITGILPVGNGGTGWANIASGAIPYGNGSSAIATTTAGTNGFVLSLANGVPTWAATTTLGNIAGTLGVGSGGTGITSTPTYGQLLVGSGSGGYALSATSSLMLALSDTTGTLAAARGGTGVSTLTANQLLIGNTGGSGWTQIATSSLNLNSDNLVEGSSNLFWTSNRFDTRLSATTTLPNITTLAYLATVGALTSGSIGSGFGAINIGSNALTAGAGSLASISVSGGSSFANSANFFGLTSFGATGTTTISAAGTISTPSIIANSAAAFAASFGATATSTFSSSGALSLAGGLNGPLHSNNGLVSATTSIGVLYGGTGLTTAPSYGQVLLGNSSGGYTLTATSSLGLGSSGSGGGQLLAVYATSTPGSNVSVNFNGASGSSPSFSAGVLTLPSNTSYFVVEMWSGGAGGQGGASSASGGGGESGAYALKLINAPSGTYYYTVGAGGAGASSYGASAGGGGQSCFGTNATACTSPAINITGGGAPTDANPGRDTSAATGGDVNISGMNGHPGFVTGTNVSGGNGGSTPRGGTGGNGYFNIQGDPGKAPGGGGAGGGYNGSNTSGGNGAPGGLVIEIYTTGISNGSLASGTAGQFAFYNAAGTNLSATSSLFVDTSTSRIGIGTTTPGSLFSINYIANFQTGTSTIYENLNVLGALKVGTGSIYLNGSATSTFSTGLQTSALNITSSTATSTFANGIQLSGGCVLVGGSCLGSGSGSVGSGTQGQFAFYNVTGTSLAATSTLTLLQSGLLGIGTTTPTAKLTVYGDIFAEGSNRYLNFGTTQGSSGYGFRDNSGTLEFKNSGGTWQGVTTATSGPSFSVYKDANETVTTNTYLKLTWPIEVFDTNNNFASDRFTPTVPGKYIITVTVYCTDSTSYCFALIYKNGTRVYAAANRTNADQSATITGIVDMNGSTDYVEGWGYNGGGTTIQGDANQRLSTFSGALIAPVNATAGGWQNDGTQSFLADSTDLVGIGTSTPWAKLAINPLAGDANQFVVGSSSATSFIINNAGRVGIGTTTPGSLFSINNIANFQTGTSTFYTGLTLTGNLDVAGTATSTFANGIQLSGGCFSINGNCIGGSSFSNTLANGGTATTTFYNGGVVFSDGSKLTQSAAAANFFWDETNKRLGIGTSTPGSIFSIQSIANFQSGTSTIYDNLNVQGQLKVGTGSIYLNGAATSTFSSGIQGSALNLLTGGALSINGTGVLNATTLGSGVTASSLTSVGTITSGTWTGTTIAVANGGTGATTAANARTNLGVTATGGDTTYAFRSSNLSDLGSAATARTNLGVSATGADTTYAFRSNNLSDLGNAGTARSNLGLGSMATQNTGVSGTDICIYTMHTFSNGILTSFDESACDGDIAENYGTEEAVVRGEIVAFGTTVSSRQFKVSVPAPGESTSTPYTITTSNVRKATFDTRSRIIGAIPTAPQMLGSDVIDPADHPQLVALVGHVPIKMTLDGGDVAIGDPITVSNSTPGWGMKATTSGRILGYALENFSAAATSSDGMIEVYIEPQDWIAAQDFSTLLDLSQLTATSTETTFTTRFFSSLFTRLTQWFAEATNGIRDFYASIVHAHDVQSDESHTNKLCVGSTCVSEDQLKAMMAGTAAGADPEETVEAPASQPAPEVPSADTATTTTPTEIEPPAANAPEVNGTGAPASGAPQSSTAPTDNAASTPTVTEPPTRETDGASEPAAEILPAANDNPPPLDGTGTPTTTP